MMPWRYQFSLPVNCRKSLAVRVFVVVMVLSPLRMGCAIAADARRQRRRLGRRGSPSPPLGADKFARSLRAPPSIKKGRAKRSLSNLGASASPATAQGRIVKAAKGAARPRENAATRDDARAEGMSLTQAKGEESLCIRRAANCPPPPRALASPDCALLIAARRC